MADHIVAIAKYNSRVAGAEAAETLWSSTAKALDACAGVEPDAFDYWYCSRHIGHINYVSGWYYVHPASWDHSEGSAPFQFLSQAVDLLRRECEAASLL